MASLGQRASGGVRWARVWAVVIAGLFVGSSLRPAGDANGSQVKLPYYTPNRCGAVSLYVTCALHGKEATIDELVKLTQTDQRGTTVYHLVGAASGSGGRHPARTC